jgi:hypothetical protein
MQANSNFFDFSEDRPVADPQAPVLFVCFMKNLALELKKCAAAQEQLSYLVSSLVDRLPEMSHDNIVKLQSLDHVTQILVDLANVIESCAALPSFKNGQIPEEHLSVLKLAELRSSLIGP